MTVLISIALLGVGVHGMVAGENCNVRAFVTPDVIAKVSARTYVRSIQIRKSIYCIPRLFSLSGTRRRSESAKLKPVQIAITVSLQKRREKFKIDIRKHAAPGKIQNEGVFKQTTMSTPEINPAIGRVSTQPLAMKASCFQFVAPRS